MGFFSSVNQALRVFRKNPGFAISALAILTLGIGANTAIFSVVNTVLLRPLPFPEPEGIVTVYHVPPAAAFPGIKRFSVSVANYLDWRAQNDVFDAMSVYSARGLRVGGGTTPQVLKATISDAGFFRVLRVKPEAGRLFTGDECQPGRDNVIVLSDGTARSYFGSPSGALGRTMELGKRTYSVIGVMPPEFHVKSWSPMDMEAWIPNAWTEKDRATRGNHNWLVVARLKPGVTKERAQSAMNVISDRLAKQYPEEDKGWGAIVIPLRDLLVGSVRPALLTLLGAVGFVLLIACANTANLVLARTIARRKEFAIRAAIGASRRQVLHPVLVETTLLALIGGALGLLVARSGQSLVTRALADQLPRATEVQMDARVLAFTLIASVLTGLAAGLLAGSRLLKGNLNDSLKQGFGKTDSYSAGKRTRGALVVAEVALSLMLLVGAGLMIRTLWALRGTDPGFRAENVLTMSVPIPASSDTAKRSKFYDEFLPKVAALPGVASAAAIDYLPLDGGSEQPITVEGRPAEVFALQRNVSVRQATPNYFHTMGIPIVAGRDFTMAETTDEQAPAVISVSMARLFWPGENAIGKRFRISFTPDTVRTVVGVVGDIKDRGLDGLEAVTMLYLPIAQDYKLPVNLVVRGSSHPVTNLTAGIRGVLANIDPTLPIRNVETMDNLVMQTLAQHRFSMWLFAALALLALLLAIVGIYSVLAYSVRTRVHEIGIRIALGASAGDVLRMIVAEGMQPALLGVLIGAAGAFALGGVLSKLIYGVSAADPLTFGAVAAILVAVAVTACVLPGYRATRVQPVVALRNE
ncbi:MAG TPA: ABC transporter permease [Candidatus Limnocylindrales bacterium]|nr:ABC transporter permease [Candidatus Limnocylindrales bacterium]